MLLSPIGMLLLVTTTYTTATTLHFNDFCGQTHKSVVFTSKLNRNQCVCFGTGAYEHHSHSAPCSPTTFYFEDEQCVEMPSDTKAITKLEITGSEMPSGEIFKDCSDGRSGRVKRAEDEKKEEAEDETMDEDFSSQGVEIGQELMRNQMSDYVEGVITKLVGLHGEGGGGNGDSGVRHKYPVIKLMDYTKQIMQKTCAVVNPDFFDLALNSFINMQLETYHIKEPYIGYSAFKRIELAMTRCLQHSTPHVFVTADWESKSSRDCENHMTTKSSNQTVINSGTASESVLDINIPPYASAELEPGKIAEPLIETVWKMLVSAHSYCYEYFSDYFNDHHTYTVALLPLFSNEIQDVWLNEAGEGGKGYDLNQTGSTKLYGGLLGDVINVLRDVDYCVGASRAITSYPWFMNRPLRDTSNAWNKRRKREASGESDDEAHFVSGKIVTDDNVLIHECRNTVHFGDSCRRVKIL